MNSSLKITFFVFVLFAFAGCDTNDYATYETWDVDNNQLIDENEFTDTYVEADYYAAWDTDGDGIIDETEWETGVTTYYPAYTGNVREDYTAWDLNQDNRLDEDEFTAGTYRLWDTDGDGNIEVVEYEEWYHDI